MSSSASLFFLESQGAFQLKKIELVIDGQYWPENLSQLVRDEVEGEFKHYYKQSLWDISIRQMDEKLSALHWIHTSRVTKRWPGQIKVNIRAKKISFYLMSDGGELITVFADASLYKKFPTSLLPSRPIAREVWFYDDEKLRYETVGLLEQLPKTGLFSQTSISDISWNAFDGFSLRLLSHQTKVLLGRGNFSKKIKRVAQVIEYLDAHQKTGRVIDAAYSQKVLVRLRNGP